MRRNTRIMVLGTVATILICLSIFLKQIPASSADARVITFPSSSRSATVSSSLPTGTTSGGSGGEAAAIPAAWIYGVLTIVAAAIGATIALVGNWLITREKRRYKQRRQSKRTQLAVEEAALQEMRHAKTIEDRVNVYRKLLQTDPLITHLQILDMNRPLPLSNVYVAVRLHQESRLKSELDSALKDAETKIDPNISLRAEQEWLETRASSSLELTKALQADVHCAFIGDAGAGKTTLLKHLALKSVQNQLSGIPCLPIYIVLNQFARSGQHDLLDFVSSWWEQHYLFPRVEARKYIEEQLQAEQAILLLDALDETVIGNTPSEADASYTQVRDAILQVATRYPRSRILVTTRKATYYQRAPLPGFTVLDILGFRPEEIREFITKWFDAYQDPQKQADAIDLINKLERNPHIYALASNALLLSLITIVYESKLDLPDRRAELYKQCMEVLLTRWDVSRDIRRRREFKSEYKQQLLEDLAWHFHSKGRRYFPENELITEIAQFLPTIRLPAENKAQVLAEITSESGILKEQARGWYGFLHLTLQEYFATRYAIVHNKMVTLLEHVSEPWWEEVLLLYAGSAADADASSLVRKLLWQSKDVPLEDDLFHTHLFLAGRCLAARSTIREISLWQDVVTRLFEVLFTTPYSLAQRQAAEILSAIGGEDINARLLQLLHAGAVSEEIAKKRNNIGGIRKEYPFKLLFIGDAGRDLRESIAYALGTYGERSVAFPLLKLLANGEIDKYINKRIATALGMLGERSVALGLLDIVANKKRGREVCRNIIIALGKLGEPSVIPGLQQLLTDKRTDSSLSRPIVQAIADLGGRAVLPDLAGMLSNEQTDSSLRAYIADVLGSMGDYSVAASLLRLLSKETVDSSLREHIASALGRLGDRSVVSDLQSLLLSDKVSEPLRERIVEALGQLGEYSIVPELRQLLLEKNADVERSKRIVEIFGNLGVNSVIPDLVNLLVDKEVDASLRVSIADVLGRLGDRSITPDLLNLLYQLSDDQHSWYLGRPVAQAVGRVGEHSSVADLLHLLYDERIDPGLRLGIAEALKDLARDGDTKNTLITSWSSKAYTDVFTNSLMVANKVYEILWMLSNQLGIRVYIRGEYPEQLVVFIKQRPSSRRSYSS